MKDLKVKVENMTSSNGNDVPNQFIITTDKGEYFQSYNSIIAFIPKGNFTEEQHKKGLNKIQLDSNTWDYSRTTGKYRNQFLGEDKKETEKKIKEGIYVLTDLN